MARAATERARGHLIVALDVPTAAEAHAIVEELGDTVSFYKIGLILQLDREFRSLLETLLEKQKDIFLDFKYIDIPATIEGAVRAASKLGIKFITVMGQSHIVKAADTGRLGSDLKILAVTLLTGMTERDMRIEYNTELTLESFIKERAKKASNMGCDGAISSPNEVKLIRSVVKRDDFLVVTPGIRNKGATPDDQKRTATPYIAVLNGADYLVVGRPIIQMKHKWRAARDMIDEMASALENPACLHRAASLPVPAEVD